MKLLTAELLKKLPTLDATAETPIAESKVVAKFFNPCGGGTWFATAYDPKEKLFFGFVTLGDAEMAELGYFSLEELESLRFRAGLRVERDRFFTEMPLQEVMDAIRIGKHI